MIWNRGCICQKLFNINIRNKCLKIEKRDESISRVKLYTILGLPK